MIEKIEPQPIYLKETGQWQIEWFIFNTVEEVESYIWYNLYLLELGNSLCYEMCEILLIQGVWFYKPAKGYGLKLYLHSVEYVEDDDEK